MFTPKGVFLGEGSPLSSNFRAKKTNEGKKAKDRQPLVAKTVLIELSEPTIPPQELNDLQSGLLGLR